MQPKIHLFPDDSQGQTVEGDLTRKGGCRCGFFLSLHPSHPSNLVHKQGNLTGLKPEREDEEDSVD